MKGVKVGIKEGIIILLAFVFISNWLGLWITAILLFGGMAYNTYLLSKEKKQLKTEKVETQK